MEPQEHLQSRELPDLRAPIMLAGFAGWNDAAQVATFSISTLIKTWGAERFAEIDPESFFDFTETRPTISIGSTGQRSLEWPSNYFFSYGMEESDRDLVLLLGTEPQLKWRTFSAAVIGLAEKLEASSLITLGGLLADVPHTLEPRLSGFATPGPFQRQLRKLGIRASSYEGPTGIVGALHDAWRRTGRPAVSLWGNVPHYISATPNPQVSLALLERVVALLKVKLSLTALANQAKAFGTRIDEALAENPEALEYVRQLEQQFGNEPPPAADAPELIAELENFLRSRRPPTDQQPDA